MRCSRLVVLTAVLVIGLLPLPGMGLHATTAPKEPFDHYRVTARFDPAARQVSGSLAMEWFNTTGRVQDRVPFRLYPNAPAYEHGGIEISVLTVNDAPATFELTSDPTVGLVRLADPVAPGDTVRVAMSFTTTIPTGTSMAVNVLHGDVVGGWWLADWLPILAGWEPGHGWYLEPPGTLGNPTFATSALWSLAITMPADLIAFGTGTVVGTEAAGSTEQTLTIETAPARDLTLALVPVGDHVVTERMVGDLQVRLVVPAAMANSTLTHLVMDTASAVLPVYQRTLGDLPGGEIDLVATSLAGFGGIAWSGSIWLDLPSTLAGPSDGAREDVRFVLAHELAHQWLPVVVGSNNNRHNYLSESLASHLALLAIREANGADDAGALLARQVAAPYLALLAAGEDGVVDDPVASTLATADRVALIYGKGVLGFEAIRQQIGPDAYARGLAAYATDFRFAISDPADLRDVFELASDQDLTALWATWFTSATTTAADVEGVVANFDSPRQSGPELPASGAWPSHGGWVAGCQTLANRENQPQTAFALRLGDPS